MSEEVDDTIEAIDPQLFIEQPVSIAELLVRLQVSKPTLYNYFSEAGVTPVRDGRQAYVTREESEWIGAMWGALKNGKAESVAAAVENLRASGIPIPGKEPETKLMKKTTRQPDTLGDEGLTIVDRSSSTLIQIGQAIITPLVEAIAKFNVKADVNLTPQKLTLKHYEELEKAYEKGWLLSTSELAGLLKMSAGSITKEFKRGGFRFVKAGKNGRESAWKVLKAESSDHQ